MKKSALVITGLSLLALASCGGSKAEETKTNTDTAAVAQAPVDTVKNTADDLTKFKFDFAIANIPSPAQIINDFSSYNLNYNPAFLNDVQKVSGYNTEYSKAINLGIYNLDMAYAVANDKGSDVLKYMKTTMAEIDALGMKAAFNQFVGKRAETNIGNKDSLLKIIDELYTNGDKYLRTNQRIETATHIFVGSWVEALNIICHTGADEKDAAQKARVYKHLWEQRFYLKNIIDLLDAFKAKKEDADLIKDLSAIHAEVDAVKDAADINDEKFKSISAKIFALRDKMTK
ncbi:MAG: hypothetical protein ACXVPN_02315 [Bacteroidia bacterium]